MPALGGQACRTPSLITNTEATGPTSLPHSLPPPSHVPMQAFPNPG